MVTSDNLFFTPVSYSIMFGFRNNTTYVVLLEMFNPQCRRKEQFQVWISEGICCDGLLLKFSAAKRKMRTDQSNEVDSFTYTVTMTELNSGDRPM